VKVHDLKIRLLKKAEQSSQKYRVSAIGLNARGVPIATAFNAPRFDRRGGSIHAEMKIMRSTPKSLKTIVIARLGATGKVLPIDPCPACAAKAKDLGIRIKTIKEGK
jgi:tRNA(Arg) A34 adenosine deaminase TadA